MIPSLRKTRIIATLGPVSETSERLRELMQAGVNIFRLNMSHAHHDSVRKVVPMIRQIAQELGLMVGILMDTQGPAVRTGDLPSKFELKVGDILEFTVRGAPSEEVYSVNVNYDGLIDDISEGDVMLVDNGVLHLKVLSKKNNRIRCEVLTPGPLGSRRHINLPGVRVNLPPLTEKDIADVILGCELGVDFIALSFCREANDILEMKRLIEENHGTARVIAKIEDQSAVKFIEEIIEATDAVMIARGDLGVECPMEELPIIQRRIMKKAIQLGRPVIVATHLLESMIENPVPTRAEITDVANAVFEQADAIMLSGETTVGKYPVECVRVMDRVARRIERSGYAAYVKQTELENAHQKTTRAGVSLANSLPDSGLIVFTSRGVMADYTSQLRPQTAPIFAVTSSEIVARHLILNWGTHPIVASTEQGMERVLSEVEDMLLKSSFMEKGNSLVILSDLEEGEKNVDSIELRKI
ncbi:MAG: pyruvate kinase [Verrucomicrobia bacterium]|nr:MAG: pyruvate kinase [Verrucomicrobiota bacterium]